MPIKIYDDKKEKWQSFEATIDIVREDIPTAGYGSDINEAIQSLKAEVLIEILRLKRQIEALESIDYNDFRIVNTRN